MTEREAALFIRDSETCEPCGKPKEWCECAELYVCPFCGKACADSLCDECATIESY